MAHGLIRASLVPPTAIGRQLGREMVQHVQRIQKTLEDGTLTIVSVLSDVIGPSGRARLEDLIAGETRPDRGARARHRERRRGGGRDPGPLFASEPPA